MAESRVVIIDFGVGNLLSVVRAIEYCGSEALCTSDVNQIKFAERLILPGVGAFANAMQSLESLGLISAIQDVAAQGTPLLGICLGMQLLLDQSQEFGNTQGLGIIPGQVIPIPNQTTEGTPLKIPHIGWNKIVRNSNANWTDFPQKHHMSGSFMYFVHSFMAVPYNPLMQLAYCVYGGHMIPAVIKSGSVIGCQFHPEKSGEAGLNLLRNFCASKKNPHHRPR
jgi:glutamine amidotransferase